MTRLPPPDPRIDQAYRDYWMPLYERGAREPLTWVSCAHALYDSANLLLPQIARYNQIVMEESRELVERGVRSRRKRPPAGWNLSRVWMMLMAFALENVLKATLVAKSPTRVANGRIAKWEGGGHDLVELARTAKARMNGEEEALLLKLSVYATWMGRYPCPRNLKEHLPRTTVGGGYGSIGGISSGDYDRIRKIYRRLIRVQGLVTRKNRRGK